MTIRVTYQPYSAYSMVLRGDLDDYRDTLMDSRHGKLDCTFNELLKGGPGWIVRGRNKQLVADWLNNEPGIEVVEEASDPDGASHKPDLDLHQVMRLLNTMQKSLASLETSIHCHLRQQETTTPTPTPTPTVRKIIRKPKQDAQEISEGGTTVVRILQRPKVDTPPKVEAEPTGRLLPRSTAPKDQLVPT